MRPLLRPARADKQHDRRVVVTLGPRIEGTGPGPSPDLANVLDQSDWSGSVEKVEVPRPLSAWERLPGVIARVLSVVKAWSAVLFPVLTVADHGNGNVTGTALADR